MADVLVDRGYWAPEIQRLGNFRTLLGVPMMSEGVPTGVIILWRHEVVVFEDDQIELVATFATRRTIAIASAELFWAINDKNRELEVASPRKSEFLPWTASEMCRRVWLISFPSFGHRRRCLRGCGRG